jgi:hypothetical protein
LFAGHEVINDDDIFAEFLDLALGIFHTINDIFNVANHGLNKFSSLYRRKPVVPIISIIRVPV